VGDVDIGHWTCPYDLPAVRFCRFPFSKALLLLLGSRLEYRQISIVYSFVSHPSQQRSDANDNDNSAKPEKMFRKPSSQLHLPLLALLAIALIISIATLACAATTLNLFESQQSTNPWLLPVWRSHFDLRGLKLVVGTSAAVAIFDLVAMVVVVLAAVQVRLPFPSI
jgi:hypothetical protein